MKLVSELKLDVGFSEKDIILAICKKVSVNEKQIVGYEIIKQGIDARKKPNVFYVLNVAVDFYCTNEKIKNLPDIVPNHSGLNYNQVKTNVLPPVVVGFGPSGMFCALCLALAGLKPIVLERGKCVEERQKDVDNFWNNRVLNENSNVQFGEGGAGTFSDGKLNTTLNNEYCKRVINELILNGAPKEIFYKNKAHIGTDNLKIVVKNIREKIEKLGGKVVFNAFFNDFNVKNGQIDEIFYKNLQTEEVISIKTNNLVLAIGHSPLDTFELLRSKQIAMHQKPFAMGVRIEHLQEIINEAQYGKSYNKKLPSADYKLVEHLPNGRSVFSFCMCPGGVVVASSSERGGVVTNGMSEFSRNTKYANSALLVNVVPGDFNNDDVLAGLYFQRKYEKLAFEIAGKNYNAPAQMVGNFLGKTNAELQMCSYKPNVTFCKIENCLPKFVAESLKEALPKLDKKIKGFAGDNAVLIGVETRSSCPVQFERNENYVCTFGGVYACGEGAGYAGGIVSSAVDGVKCAEKIIKNY